MITCSKNTWSLLRENQENFTETRFQERLATIKRNNLEEEFKAYCEKSKLSVRECAYHFLKARKGQLK